MMSKTLERRDKLRDSLILAAERRIAAGGLAGLKTRDLARDIGCANAGSHCAGLLRLRRRQSPTLARAVRTSDGAGQTDSGLGDRSADGVVPSYLSAARCAFPDALGRRTKRDGAKPVLGGAWHGDTRPRAEADRGADRRAAQRDRDDRASDGQRACAS